MEPGINSAAGSINRVDNGAVICSTYALLGVPIRNQLNKIRTDWGEGRFMITLRGTDSFGEVLIDMDPANGKATAYSITIDRILKGIGQPFRAGKNGRDHGEGFDPPAVQSVQGFDPFPDRRGAGFEDLPDLFVRRGNGKPRFHVS